MFSPAAIGVLLVLRSRASHDFHPGNQADGLVPVPLDFRSSIRYAIQVVDQDIGIEKDFHHSDRMVS